MDDLSQYDDSIHYDTRVHNQILQNGLMLIVIKEKNKHSFVQFYIHLFLMFNSDMLKEFPYFTINGSQKYYDRTTLYEIFKQNPETATQMIGFTKMIADEKNIIAVARLAVELFDLFVSVFPGRTVIETTGASSFIPYE